jgi:hypothetical protein
MITVSQEWNKYRVKLSGDRTKYFANTPQEAATAVLHYYGIKKHNGKKCPLCRSIEQEQKKKRGDHE